VTARPESGEDWRAQHIPALKRSTLDEVLADETIAAIAIATPIPLLAPFAEAALKAGKHVFAEKPLAPTSGEAGRLADLAADRGLTLQTGYVFLHHPVYREIKRRIDIASVRAIRMDWRKFGTFDEPIELSLLVHHLSLALDLAGLPRGGTIRRGAGVRSGCDRVEATLDHGGLSIVSTIDRTVEQRSHTVTLDMSDGAQFVWEDGRLSHRDDAATPQLIYENNEPSLDAEMAAFVAAVHGAPAPAGSGPFAADVLGILEGLHGA
jgi:predicted dehydrogenase